MMEKADPAQKLYNRMRLYEFSDQYIVEPSDGSSAPFLAISRSDASMNFTDDIPLFTPHRAPKIWNIFGVVGILKLVAGSYLLVITERACVGRYLGYPLFKIISLKIFPCDHSLKTAPEEEKKMESEFSHLLNIVKKTPNLFFSYDVNITLSAQKVHDLGDESKLLPLWRQADPRFIWNSYILEMLKDNKLDPFLLPVMQGSFQSFQFANGKDVLDVTLIARRCNRRNGTRMWRRGADSDGFVANFVETEQIVQFNGQTASLVQVRGSIPLLWDQIVDLSYKPKFQIMKSQEVTQVVERHFSDLRKRYGNVLVVNLVNTHGDEGRLCEKYGSAMQHISCEEVRYLHFDFHKICGDQYIGWLSILYNQIGVFVYRNRYFLLNEKGEKVQRQMGVVRTNCVDCLDRTNVTQSLIARKTLEAQLRRLGVFSDDDTISNHPNLDESFKNLWGNHGDDISIQYTGTPAMKRDFVRCGQRTVLGILEDSWTGLLRYYLNNFCDGRKQDAIDLLQGQLSVPKNTASTKKNAGVESMASFRVAFTLIMTGLYYAAVPLSLGNFEIQLSYGTLTASMPLGTGLTLREDPFNILSSFIWAGVSLMIAKFVKANGRLFCDRPRLHPPSC